MQFAKITSLSILALSATAMAVPAPVPAEDVTALEARADTQLEKRFGPIAVLLVKVIGGQLLAGAAKAAVDIASGELKGDGTDIKDFEEARRHFTPVMAKDLYVKRVAGVKGVSCHNGPYAISPGAKVQGPINIKFKWDVGYNTDYDCFEITSGTITNKGDGGYENYAVYGTCKFNVNSYTC
ncbi:Hypothetical protein D9617_15g041930 [Elsinoe fawcettii]|nr:Hypothetical protein D9617_15g041930 [Elsinoe fawcettii]